jgi:hypothetical protein
MQKTEGRGRRDRGERYSATLSGAPIYPLLRQQHTAYSIQHTAYILQCADL